MIFWLYLVKKHSHTCTLTRVLSYHTCPSYLSSLRLWWSCDLCHGSCQVSAVENSLALPWITMASHVQRNRLIKKQNTFIKVTEIVKNLNKKLFLRQGTIPTFIILLVNLLSTTILHPDVSFKTSKVNNDNKLLSQKLLYLHFFLSTLIPTII